MLLLDSGTLTRVMEMIHPPILLAQGWDNVIVNSVMGAAFPLGFTMPASNVAFIVPTTMITEVFLLENVSYDIILCFFFFVNKSARF